MIDKNAGIGHLRGVLEEFLSQLFEKQITTRFRPGYFPFTEPSLELDMSCVFCDQKGCKVCKHTGFIELLGCGMVHPNVLRSSNVDPEEYQGFAFGMGLDRILMLKYGFQSVCDIRANDQRLLKQL
jgi:phenylalanyl-tRNA synthetase alpha chain